MCTEVWTRWSGCGHLTFKTYAACSAWSDAHSAAAATALPGSECCRNFDPHAAHATEEVPDQCPDCLHLGHCDSEWTERQ